MVRRFHPRTVKNRPFGLGPRTIDARFDSWEGSDRPFGLGPRSIVARFDSWEGSK